MGQFSGGVDTDTTATPRDVLDCFDRRWSVETTYEEARAHLGVETQRQWSDPAIFRALYVYQNAELGARRSG